MLIVRREDSIRRIREIRSLLRLTLTISLFASGKEKGPQIEGPFGTASACLLKATDHFPAALQRFAAAG